MSPKSVEDGAHVSSNNLNLSAGGFARAHKPKFRFKSSKRKSDCDSDYRSSVCRDSHHRQQHYHRSKRRKAPKLPDNSFPDDNTHMPNESSEQYLDPDTAFRESLFDAMADDEGAQFWEGVYGQPIPKIPLVKIGPKGELEAMTDDEYAAHIRAEMYKKTHQYLFEEKARREKARREQAEKEKERQSQRAGQEATSEQFRRAVDESLKRGRDGKERAQRAAEWGGEWKAYERSWNELGGRTNSGAATIPWPVWRGRREDINKKDIETFFLNGPTSGRPDQADLLRTLKAERVRWHPDKMQQKLGGQGIDEIEMGAITAVFQIIDGMWTELRDGRC